MTHLTSRTRGRVPRCGAELQVGDRLTINSRLVTCSACQCCDPSRPGLYLARLDHDVPVQKRT